jgi:hypothetical protein
VPAILPPTIVVDFLGSARRHMNDADLLEVNHRNANAGQLHGFVAECGIKAIMRWLGYPTDSEGSPLSLNKAHNLRAHIENIAGRIQIIEAFVSSVSGRSGSKYLAMIPNITNFSSWSISHRYYREADLPNSFADWKVAAVEVIKMLDQATKDGMS